MAPDFRLVLHPAQGDADELPPHGPGDGTPEGGLADPRRTDEAEDRPLVIAPQGTDRQVFEDALLDFLEVVMVLIENLLGVADVELIFGPLLPGDGAEVFQVGAGRRCIRERTD